MKGFSDLEERIGYRFRDPALLEQALTHRSYAREQVPATPDNERLEFLGDAVLGLAASERLVERFPDLAEGPLTKIKANLVSAAHLGVVARRIELGSALLLGGAEENSGGREKASLLVDGLEAVIAAVHLDGGGAAARALIDRLILSEEAIEETRRNLEADNAKSTLQELLQARKTGLPVYRVVSEDGPPHKRTFTIELRVGDLFSVRAQGGAKKAAEQLAAAEALKRLAAAGLAAEGKAPAAEEETPPRGNT